MEFNGILFNTQEARKKADSLSDNMEEILEQFRETIGSSLPSITSNDDLSTVLYGGDYVYVVKIANGVFKSGKREGEIKYSNGKETISFPQLVKPLKKTETAKSVKRREKGETQGETIWQVSDGVLRRLKANKKARKLIDVVQAYGKLVKLKNTYLLGWSNLIDTMDWEKDMLHPQLNQCVTVTGRLSSSKPNGQNADKQTKQFCRSRYEGNYSGK
jgi:DNA polymerase I-like protein with 3'-5' exonuclease and polymerase domains